MKQKLVLLFISLCSLLAGYAGLELRQKNPETLFLTHHNLENYQSFMNEIPSHQTLIIQAKYSKTVTPEDFLKFKQSGERIFEICHDKCQILFPSDLITDEQQLFSKIDHSNPEQTIKLWGRDYFALIIWVKEKHRELPHQILSFIEDQKLFQSPNMTIKMAGHPYTNYLLDEYSRSIQARLFPLMFLLAFIIIIFVTKNLKNSIFLFLPALYSAFIALGSLKLVFSSLNMITSIIPLMTFTINLSLIFHLFFTFKEFGSFVEVMKYKFKPIALMLITTSAGFASLIISDIAVIRYFGLMNSVLIIFTSLITLVWFYNAEKMLHSSKPQKSISFFPYKLFSRSLKHSFIFLLGGPIIIVTWYLAPKIPIITDATHYFPKSSGLKASIDSVSSEVAGFPIIEVHLKKESNFSINDLTKLEELERKITELKVSQSVLSLVQLLKQANQQYLGKEVLPLFLPAVHTLRSQLFPPLKEEFPLNNRYKLVLLDKSLNIDLYEKRIKQLKKLLNELGYDYEINGLYYHLMMSQKEMIHILVQSFLISLTVISFLAFIAFRKLILFGLFFFVNCIPICLSLICLYLLDFSFNIATIMTYSISLGFIVDSSFHLIHALENRQSTFKSFYSTTLLPILGSSLLFILCFIIFIFNSFIPIQQFGLNLALMIFLGLLFDLYVLPTLYLGKNRVDDNFLL